MRLSLVTAFALLGFWSVFLEADGFPTGLSQHGPNLSARRDLDNRAPVAPPKAPAPPKPEPAPPKTPGGASGGSGAPKDPGTAPKAPEAGGPKPPQAGGPKPPQAPAPAPAPAPGPAQKGPINPFDSKSYDYQKSKGDFDEPWGTTYTIKTKNYDAGVANLDVIKINKDKHTIAVIEAFNGKENIAKTDPRKATLSDIEANLFKTEGGDLNDVERIHHSVVMEDGEAASADGTKPGIPSSHEVLMEARQSMMNGDVGHEGTLTLKRDSTGPEQETFNKVMNTKFPQGIDRMIGQYGIKNSDGKPKQITQFDISPAEGYTAEENDLLVHIA